MNASLPIAATGALIDACWSKVGVHGDGTCTDLQEHVHCRNCSQYMAAAAALLERDLPPNYLDEWTHHFAGEHRFDAPDTESIVVFRIGDEWLGLPTAAFSEFVDLRPVHSLPHRRNGNLLGLTNVRGELLICVSLNNVLGIEKQAQIQKRPEHAVYSRLVVIHDKDSRIVFPVDEVHGIHRYSAGELKDVPATVAKAAARYTRAMLPWNDRAIGCLDDQLLFYALNRSLA